MVARGFLAELEGTLLLNAVLRGFGMRIGKRVLLGGGFAQVVDPDMLTFEDDSTVVWHEGNYGDYLEDRRKRLGLESDTPRRPKYRRLTR